MPNGSNEYGTAEAILDAVQIPSLASALPLVTDALRAGQIDLALGIVDALRRRDADEATSTLTTISHLAQSGQPQEALKVVSEARKMHPRFLLLRIYEAQLLMGLGRREPALQSINAAVEQCPDYPGLAGMLASWLMPGPGYREVLGHLHQQILPRAYLEIGVETGATLSLSKAPNTIGIDPDFSPLRRGNLSANCRLFEMTSADFFRTHRAVEVLGETKLDLVFIDGLHRFRTAVADFAAIEGWAHDETVVVLHDVLPIAPVYATAERKTRFWVGDVWKATRFLCQRRPDLRLRIVPTPPSGLMVITKLNPKMALNSDWYEEGLDAAERVALGDGTPSWSEAVRTVANNPVGYREALGRS